MKKEDKMNSSNWVDDLSVHQMIEKLKNYPDDAVFVFQYGDKLLQLNTVELQKSSEQKPTVWIGLDEL